MTNLIIVRHGQSEGNLKRTFLGHTDLPLTELGRKQAQLTADLLKKYKIDVAYSSDLKRAYETGTIIAAEHNLTPIKMQEFREIYAGKWEGMPFSEIEEKYHEDYNLWLTNIGIAKCTDGESVEELYRRVMPALDKVSEENEGKNVLITSHATAIRVITAGVMGIDISRTATVDWVSNSSVTVIKKDEKGYHLDTLGYEKHLGIYRSKFKRN